MNTEFDMINPNIKNVKRYLGLDIIKILSMFFIIIHHFSKHGLFFDNSSGTIKIILIILNSIFLPCVNIFVYVSAFLIVKKGQATFRNFIKLYLQIVFYSLFTYFLSFCLSYVNFDFKTLIKCFFPISYSLFWFASAYLIMYMLSPLLLKVVDNTSKNDYIKVICVILIILINIKFTNLNNYLPIYNGFNAIWFCILFILAGFQEKYGYNIKKRFWIIIYILSTIASFFYIMKHDLNIDYATLPVLIQTISMFNLLYDITSYNSILNKICKYIASCTFGIYLMHDSAFIQPYLYSRIFKTYNYYTLPASLIYMFLFIFIVIISGILIEYIRKLLFRLPKRS